MCSPSWPRSTGVGSRSARDVTVAVTGLAAADNPAPGVAVARSLRAVPAFRGRVVGLTFDHRFTGGHSSHFDAVRLTPPPASGATPFIEAVRDIVHAEGIEVLVPTLDPEVLLCALMRRQLAGMRVRTLLPAHGAIRRCAKLGLESGARRAGFAVPRTVAITSRARLDVALRDLRLPFFLKGSFADARLVENAASAHAEFDRLASRWGFPLLAQERIVGDELDLAVLYDRARQRIGAIAIRKIGLTAAGKAWAGVTLDAPALLPLADRLMGAVGWSGAAELEIIRERTSGAYYLIEVNPRFPAWIYLSAAVGANLPWAAVRIALNERVAPLPTVPAGMVFTRTIEDHFGPLAPAEPLSRAAAAAGAGG